MWLTGRIKGEQFEIDTLLRGLDEEDRHFDAILKESEAALAVCRLAPQDYHRFHAPVEGEIIYKKDIKGELYSASEVLLQLTCSRQPSGRQ